MNEELQTVNQECQIKIAELSKANEDLDNFISSADMATIFLDMELRIRRFTPAAAQKMNLLAHDVGRQISELSNPLLLKAATASQRILDGALLEESVISLGESGSLIIRATPFTQNDGTRAGAVVNFIPFGSLKPE